jgi:hypothetical protein
MHTVIFHNTESSDINNQKVLTSLKVVSDGCGPAIHFLYQSEPNFTDVGYAEKDCNRVNTVECVLQIHRANVKGETIVLGKPFVG